MRERNPSPRTLRRGTVTIVTAVLAVGSVGAPAAVAAFAGGASATSTFGAAPDWVAPQVQSTAIAKTSGYLAGAIKQGGTYYVYASLTDTGSPPSGTASATANVTAITPSGLAVTLVPGTYSVGGANFTHRSTALLATSPLAAGARDYSVSSTDGAGNSRVETGFAVTVDNTAPVATDVQTTNKAGGTQGRAELGDAVAFTFSERIDPTSILAGWTGSSTNVVVRLVDGGCILNLLVTICNDDSLVVYDAANSSHLPLGSVNLKRGDHHGTVLGTSSPLTFGATGMPSTMLQSGSLVTVTLGTGSGTASTAGGTAAMVWSPSTTAFDAAGNGASGTAVTETGAADRDF
jgi:hypothetical protein